LQDHIFAPILAKPNRNMHLRASAATAPTMNKTGAYVGAREVLSTGFVSETPPIGEPPIPEEMPEPPPVTPPAKLN
jgi:hypothetical protein